MQNKTHTFTLVHHTQQDLKEEDRNFQVSNVNSVSIALQAFSSDHKDRQVMGWPYLITQSEVDQVVDRLIAELEVIRKEARKLLPER